MKKIIICILLVGGQTLLFGQKLDPNFQEYIGNKKDSYYFFQYGNGRGLIKPHFLEYELSDDGFFKLGKSEPWTKNNEGAPIYFTDSIKVFNNRMKKIKIHFNQKDSIYSVKSLYDFSLVSSPNSEIIYVSAHSEAPIYEFNTKTFEFTALPITGSNLYVRGDYLFFEAPRYSDNYSSFPKDVYRVRVDNIKNPEKILIQVNKWYPYSENVLYASTDPFLRLNEKKTYGFYNIKDGTVAESPGIATQDIIEIKDKPFLLKVEEKSGEKVFKLEEIPQPSKSFPYQISETDNQQPRGEIFQWYNIPLKEKEMSGTFVTHELLYEAPISELKTLTKAQLRILRNTFFAFQGYKFISEDLTNFFNQFEWYQKMIMGEKSNDDVIIWPDEKERIRLIKEIEDSK